MTHAPVSEPLKVTAMGDQVAIQGPDGLVASLTATAARLSAERLLQAAREISGKIEAPEDIYQKPLG